MLTVYLFTVDVNCALKSVFLVIGHTVGSHPLNVYVYCAVASLVGVSPVYSGVSHSSIVQLCNTVIQFMNLYATSFPSSQL